MVRRDCLACREPFNSEDSYYCSEGCAAVYGDSRESLIRSRKPPMVSYIAQARAGVRVTGRARSSSRRYDTRVVRHLQLSKTLKQETEEEARLRARQRLGVLPAVPLPPADTIAPPEPTDAKPHRFYAEPIGPKPYFDWRLKR